jgi:hypothetical protein
MNEALFDLATLDWATLDWATMKFGDAEPLRLRRG